MIGLSKHCARPSDTNMILISILASTFLFSVVLKNESLNLIFVLTTLVSETLHSCLMLSFLISLYGLKSCPGNRIPICINVNIYIIILYCTNQIIDFKYYCNVIIG